MSRLSTSKLAAKGLVLVPLFAALGDPTRLALVARLCSGQPCSIAQLTEDTTLTRQAVTRHLQVLEQAGLVHSSRVGRESQYALEAAALDQARAYLELVSQQWDQALERLRRFVED
jgi:DNA-binding transcriptional ArsR family regulator